MAHLNLEKSFRCCSRPPYRPYERRSTLNNDKKIIISSSKVYLAGVLRTYSKQLNWAQFGGKKKTRKSRHVYRAAKVSVGIQLHV